jgi:hypothetical protein
MPAPSDFSRAEAAVPASAAKGVGDLTDEWLRKAAQARRLAEQMYRPDDAERLFKAAEEFERRAAEAGAESGDPVRLADHRRMP